MPDLTIYHNPRCTKSRETLKLLTDAGHKPKVVEYLNTPPDAAAIRGLLKKLGIPAAKLLRRGEPVYKELGLAEKLDDEEALVAAMAANPILIERPIVVSGSKARLGRPPEAVREIL
ncbi:MAG: arsenate reductase (glutaredoxin) [Planctomycetota bacterium]|nr:arsenate reductase (glutaredoxin) [Planctomycetota bacterium]